MSEKKTALITGGNGFVGRVFSEFLDQFPRYSVVVTSKNPSPTRSDVISTDLTNADATLKMIQSVRPDVIFHLAGGANSLEWNGLISENILTTTTLADSIKKSGLPCRLVFTGSAAEYGNAFTPNQPLKENGPFQPISPYGMVKAWQSELANYFTRQGVETVIARVFNLIGPGIPRNTVVGNFVTQIENVKSGKQSQISTSNLSPIRDFIDIRDTCSALETVGRLGKPGETYNLCSGNPILLRDLLKKFIRSAGLDSNTKVDENSIRHPLGYIAESHGNSAKLQSLGEWKPKFALEQSIHDSIYKSLLTSVKRENSY